MQCTASSARRSTTSMQGFLRASLLQGLLLLASCLLLGKDTKRQLFRRRGNFHWICFLKISNWALPATLTELLILPYPMPRGRHFSWFYESLFIKLSIFLQFCNVLYDNAVHFFCGHIRIHIHIYIYIRIIHFLDYNCGRRHVVRHSSNGSK